MDNTSFYMQMSAHHELKIAVTEIDFVVGPKPLIESILSGQRDPAV